jgi:hypothetical protein
MDRQTPTPTLFSQPSSRRNHIIVALLLPPRPSLSMPVESVLAPASNVGDGNYAAEGMDKGGEEGSEGR